LLILTKDLVKPNEAFVKIKELILDCFPSDHWLRLLQVLEDKMWEALKEKVRNYVKYKRSKRISEYTLCTVQDIINICNLHLLKIPGMYLPQDDYKSAEELAEALNVVSVDMLLLFHLGSGSTLKKLFSFVDKKNKSLSEKGDV
jgi:hypothetical protein